MVALNLGSDARYGKECSDWRDIQQVKQTGPGEGLDVGGIQDDSYVSDHPKPSITV